MNPRKFLGELKRRNVYKVAIAYGVVAWLLMQIASQIFPFFEIPNWAVRLVVLLLIIGFPIALILAWAFELTPEGIRRTEMAEAEPGKHAGHRVWIYVVVIGAAVSIGLFFVGRYTARTSRVQSGELPEKSIAVLPFENLSRDPDNAYFADGIQEEILTRLSRVADLKVISRTSTQRFKSAPNNLLEIARQLGVANIVEGSVQRSADQVRVNVQLIKAATDTHLWADTFDRKLTDIFSVESEIAKAIADTLQAKLTGAEQKAVAQKPTNNSQAYEAYLRGIAINAQTSEPSRVQRAWEQFAEAVRLDPQFALAWAQKARLDSFLYFNEIDASPQRLADAKLASETAMKLQPESGDSWLAKGSYEYRCLRNYEAALSSYREAERRLPNSAEVSAEIGYVERRMGKFRESIADQERAIERDPRNNNFLGELAGTYAAVREYAKAHNLIDRVLVVVSGDQTALAFKLGYYLSEGRMDDAEKLIGQIPVDTGNVWAQRARVRYFLYRRQYDQAIAELKSIFARPDFSLREGTAWCYPTLGWAQQWKGDAAMAKATFAEGRERLEALRQDTKSTRLLLRWLSSVYAGLGDKEAALREAQQSVATMADDAFYGPNAQVNLAQIEARFGEVDSCMSRLSRLLQMPADPLTPLTIADLKLDPAWDPVRKDPRFQKLCQEKQP